MKQTDEKGNPLTYWGGLEEQTKCYCGHTTTCDCIPEEEPKQETREYDLLQHIKFCLECKNEAQAIRLIEKYGFQKREETYNEEDMMFAYEQGARLALISQSPLALHKGEFPTSKEWFEQFNK